MSLLPNTISNGDSLDAAPVMENFQALEAALGSLANANIADGAGIEASKLAHPNGCWEKVIPVLPFSADPALSGVAFDTIPTAWTTVARSRVKLRSGQVAWLCSAEFGVEAAAAGGGSNPELQILVASVVLGGAGTPVTTAPALYTIENSNPYDNTLLPVSDGDTIEIQIRQSAAGTATIRGVTCTLYFKGSPLP